MIIEERDNAKYFIVKRGRKITRRVNSGFPFSIPDAPETETFYDESYKGIVFEVVAISDDFVAAKMIWCPNQDARFSGMMITIDQTEVELRTVSETFVQNLLKGQREHNEAYQRVAFQNPAKAHGSQVSTGGIFFDGHDSKTNLGGNY